MNLFSLYAAVSAIMPMIAARNCVYPYRYCASTLRSIGYSNETIMEALNRGGCPNDKVADHYLFYCDRNLYLSFDHFGYCGSNPCIDAGQDKHDFCGQTIYTEIQGRPIDTEFCPKQIPAADEAPILLVQADGQVGFQDRI